MILVCQQCGQNLPKTAVMCPNCGSRQFAPNGSIIDTQAPTMQDNLGQSTSWFDNSQPANLASSANSANLPNLVNSPDSTWQSYTPNPNIDNTQQINHQFENQPNSSYQPIQQPAQYQQPFQQESVQPHVSNQTNSAAVNTYVSQYPIEQPYQTPTQAPIQPSMTQEYLQPNAYVPQPMQASNQLPSTALQTRKPAYTMLYAGFIRRAFAYLFDLALVGLILGLAYQLLLPQVLPQLGIRGFNNQTLALIAYGFYLFYMTLFTCLGRQATVGKVIMGEWVFGMQGQRIGFFHALIRECLKLILLPFGFLMWFTARKQTLHDLIARTVVLYDPN